MNPTVPKNLIGFGERHLLRFLVNEVSTLYEFFNFVVEPAVGPPPRKGWDYIYLAEVERVWLGLDERGLPGDVDVLIVPTFQGEARADLSCAIEVKRLALRGPKWSKNVDRYGLSQAEGLLRDGFPFVGVLHVVIANPGPPEHRRSLDLYRVIDDAGRVERIGSEERDMTGYDAAERQLQRLGTRTCSQEIGLNSVGIAGDDTHEQRLWHTVKASGGRHASRNPNFNDRLIKEIEYLVRQAGPNIPLRAADQRKRQRASGDMSG